jgi:RNA polymerase sigma factor (sigma-70 family)
MFNYRNNSSAPSFPLLPVMTDDGPPMARGHLDPLIEFIKAEHADLLRFFTWKVKCPAAAADLIQELYLRIVTLSRPETIRNPRGFLYTTAKHLAIDFLRQRDRALPRSESLDQALTVPTSVPDAETTVDAKRRLAAVLRAIETLPTRQRAAFVMFKFEEKTYDEIARELGISIKTVEHHLSKAMAYCRACFEAQDHPR